jgi:hypothetical protein
MFGIGKIKTVKADPHREFEKELLACIARARDAHVGSGYIAQKLEGEAKFLRHCLAVSYPLPSSFNPNLS